MNKNARKYVPAGLTYIADNINASQNILGLSGNVKSKWASGLEFLPDTSTVFFAGCGYQYSSMLDPLVSLERTADKINIDPQLPVVLAGLPKMLGIDIAGLYIKAMSREKNSDSQVLRDAVRVLKALKQDFGYLAEDEPCCGAPLFHTGLQNEFAANAEKAYRKLKASGVRKIIGIVPSCTHALRNLFPKVIPGFDIEVKHFIEVAAENVRHAKFTYPRPVKVAYHDPCQLGRYMGLLEQPRQVLRSIHNVELVEPAWTSGEWSTCCGGGGGFEVVFPEMSQTLAVNRVRELADTGANIIATQCPGCLMQLKSGLKALKKKDIEVVDMASLLAKSLPETNTN